MAHQYVYHMHELSKTYPGGRKVLVNINLSFYPNAKIGVLGLNGAGKSTLLRIMGGIDSEFVGEAWAAEGARVGYLPQEPGLDATKSVRENVMLGVADKRAILDRYNELAANYSDETADEMAKLQDEIEAKGLWDLDSKVDLAMDALRCPPDDARVETLSGGERRRVALCRLLLEEPELLLLDEPTNHLDAETVAWLETHLEKYPGAVLIVTHDRYFLDHVTGWILELDRGRGIPYQGNYSSWLTQKQKRLEQEGREEEARQRTIAREREWMAASPKARQAKGKARIQRYEELVAQSTDGGLGSAQIIVPPGPRLGDLVIEADGLGKAYGDLLLFEKLSFKLPPGGIVGVIGPNGAGKTTPFRPIPGQARLRRPEPRLARRQEERVGGDLGRRGHPQARPPRNAEPRLCRGVQLQGLRPAEEGGRAIGRRAQPRASCENAEVGRERAPARRADQRPRRGDAARARGGARRLRRLRGHHQPRPLLPRPHRHAHSGVRGRQPRGLVRGQLRSLRGRQKAPSRHRRRYPAPDQV